MMMNREDLEKAFQDVFDILVDGRNRIAQLEAQVKKLAHDIDKVDNKPKDIVSVNWSGMG